MIPVCACTCSYHFQMYIEIFFTFSSSQYVRFCQWKYLELLTPYLVSFSVRVIYKCMYMYIIVSCYCANQHVHHVHCIH